MIWAFIALSYIAFLTLILAFLRGSKLRSMTNAEREHLDAVQQLGCLACRQIGYWDTPAEIHHIRSGIGKGQRASNFEVLPLCPHHHRNGGYGEAFHAGPKIWQERFGQERELLKQVHLLVGYSPEEKAA